MIPSSRAISASVALVVLLAAGFTLAQERTRGVPAKVAEPQEKAQAGPKKLTVMERKLLHAQKLLEGLALKDFDKIDKSAEGLMECLKEATWRINDTDKYLLYSNEFLRNIEGMQKASKKKNIDAATLAYVEMTLTCVKCHEHLRETRIGAAPGFNPNDIRLTAK